jgi:hypothetical protein
LPESGTFKEIAGLNFRIKGHSSEFGDKSLVLGTEPIVSGTFPEN